MLSRHQFGITLFLKTFQLGRVLGLRNLASAQLSQSWEREVRKVTKAVIEKAKRSPRLYDTRDVQKLQSDPALARRFLRLNADQRDVNTEALKELVAYLHWRKAESINDIQQSDIPGEFHEWGLFNAHHDTQSGTTNFYIRGEFFQRNPPWNGALHQALQLYMERALEQKGWGEQLSIRVYQDHRGTSATEADMGFVFGLVNALTKYPDACEACFFLDVPWLGLPMFYAAATILPARYAKLAQQIDRRGLLQQLSPAKVPDFMGGTLKLDYTAPEGCSTLAEQARKRRISDASLRRMEKHIAACVQKRQRSC